MKKVALYARVSTDKQTTENQLNELRAVANRMGYVITQEYVHNGILVAKSRADRPSLDAMMKDSIVLLREKIMGIKRIEKNYR
jgi:DNA invertase Pin-like site-specific DNA recombinase